MTIFLADVIWPGMSIAFRLDAIWMILLGLFFEWIVVKWTLQAPWNISLLATAFINTISGLFGGLILAPFLGTFKFTLKIFVFSAIDSPFSLSLTFLLSLFLTICIEVISLIVFCEAKLYKNKGLPSPPLFRIWVGVIIGNTLSISIPFIYLILT